MSKDLEPFIQVELEILLRGRAQKSPSPPSPFSMCNGSANRAPRGEEEYVNVWVYLADNREADIEVEVQSFQWNVGSQRPVFPFVTERVGG